MSRPFEIRCGDALAELAKMPDESVNCVITSPPYYGLRDYGHAGQIGLEPTLAEFLARLVAPAPKIFLDHEGRVVVKEDGAPMMTSHPPGVFDEIRRVLKKDGTCWVNMGDSYACSTTSSRTQGPTITGQKCRQAAGKRRGMPDGLQHKDLMGQPWRLAFAMQQAGWILRQDIIWHKPNPMPESVRDRCTRAHEYLFMFARQPKYFYDAAALREPSTDKGRVNGRFGRKEDPRARPPGSAPRQMARKDYTALGKNKRSVWRIVPAPSKAAHFAVFPPALVRPCVLAGCPIGGLVLDPFSGSGTTGAVAIQERRRYIGIELNPDYAELSRRRLEDQYQLGVQTNLLGQNHG